MARYVLASSLFLAACSSDPQPHASSTTPSQGAGSSVTTMPSQPSSTAPISPLLLTREDQIDSHVGQLVTLEGVVSNHKIATLLGVDIDADQGGLRGKRARATGVIAKTTVTAQELDDAIARSGQFANRGPGTFYSLTAPGGSGLARAVPAP